MATPDGLKVDSTNRGAVSQSKRPGWLLVSELRRSLISLNVGPPLRALSISARTTQPATAPTKGTAMDLSASASRPHSSVCALWYAASVLARWRLRARRVSRSLADSSGQMSSLALGFGQERNAKVSKLCSSPPSPLSKIRVNPPVASQCRARLSSKPESAITGSSRVLRKCASTRRSSKRVVKPLASNHPARTRVFRLPMSSEVSKAPVSMFGNSTSSSSHSRSVIRSLKSNGSAASPHRYPL